MGVKNPRSYYFQYNLSLNKGVGGSRGPKNVPHLHICCSLMFLVSKNGLKPLSTPNSSILVASNVKVGVWSNFIHYPFFPHFHLKKP